MTLRGLLKKKAKVDEPQSPEQSSSPTGPEFKIIRSDTHSQEVLVGPFSPSTNIESIAVYEKPGPSKRSSRFRSLSNASSVARDLKGERRLSQLLNLRSHSHDLRTSSANIPIDLPKIDNDDEGHEEREARWEERATILAKENANVRSSVPPEKLCSISPSVPTVPITKATAAQHISNAKGDVRA